MMARCGAADALVESSATCQGIPSVKDFLWGVQAAPALVNARDSVSMVTILGSGDDRPRKRAELVFARNI